MTSTTPGPRRSAPVRRILPVLLAVAGWAAVPAGPASAAAGTLSVAPVTERTDSISPGFLASAPCPAAATHYVVTVAGAAFPAGTNAVGSTEIQEPGRPVVANLGNTWNDFADNVGARRPLAGTATLVLKCVDLFGQRTYATFSSPVSFVPAPGVGDGRTSRWTGTCTAGALCAPASYRPGADGRTVAVPAGGEADPGGPAPAAPDRPASSRAAPSPAATGSASVPAVPRSAPGRPAGAASGAGTGSPVRTAGAAVVDVAARPGGGAGGGAPGGTAGVLGTVGVGLAGAAALVVAGLRRRRGELYRRSGR